ncbi:MAG: ADP-ribosylglycohydrolase family protein [Solobacterium sp.]|nr:ADP-ribosylglycohydrolase family protein [Solobacterium sp.]
MTSTKYDRIKGAYLGCAIGDAMGAPTETRPIDLIKQDVGNGDYVREFLVPRPDTLAAGQPAGQCTDDFSVSYLSSKAFVEAGGITKEAAEKAMVEWSKYDRYYISHSGPTSKRAIALIKGEKVDTSQDYAACANGWATNGAGMKAWVAGVFNMGNVEKAIDDAIVMCKVTHDNPVALSGACAVAAATAVAMTKTSTIDDVVKAGLYGAREGYKRSWNMTKPSAGASVEERIRMAVTIGVNYANDFDRLLEEMTGLVGTGLNANEAIPAAFGFFVAAKGKVMDAVYMGVNCGNDTDTVAAIAGAMAGAYSGAKDIPNNYMSFLSKANDLDIKGLIDEVDKFLD